MEHINVVTFGDAYAMGIACDGDKAFLAEIEGRMEAMELQLTWDEAEAFETELEREYDRDSFFSRIENTYGSMVRELL